MRTPPVFDDDFSAGLQIPPWGLAGTGTGTAEFDRKNVTVADGVMSVAVAQGADGAWRGGCAILQLPQVYGEYRIRARVDAGSGHFVALLWKDGGGWPPEIDFFEGGNLYADRQRATQTLHYGPDNAMIHTSALGDFTQWHTIGCIWEPGKLTYTLDGAVSGRVTSPNVPDAPMNLHLQTAMKDGVPAPMSFQISRVRVWS